MELNLGKVRAIQHHMVTTETLHGQPAQRHLTEQHRMVRVVIVEAARNTKSQKCVKAAACILICIRDLGVGGKV